MFKKYLTCFLIFCTIFSLSIPAAFSETQFVINGRGNNHGVGLCMWGVKGMASSGYDYKTILKKYYTGIAFSPADENQTIRVGLTSNASSLTFSATGSFQICDTSNQVKAALAGGQTAAVTYSGGSYIVKTSTGSNFTMSTPVRFIPIGSSDIRLTSITGRTYDGFAEARWGAKSSKLFAINYLSLREYLMGLGEEPETFPYQGLKVLTVAARSYVLEKKTNPNSRHKGDNFDVCASPDCQYYVGKRVAPNLQSAVDETRGEIMTYNGAVIIAAYHSSCGGHTENNENVWPGTPLGYLRGVPCGFCTASPDYSWSFTYTLTALQSKLNSDSRTVVPGALTGFEILKTGASPRVITLRIKGTSGNRDVSGSVFKSVMGYKSTWFYFGGEFKRTTRISGLTRYLTAISLSQKYFGNSGGLTPFAVLATGVNYPDALCAGPLAYKIQAPILLNPASELMPEVLAELKRLGVSKVFLTGGEAALTAGVREALEKEGIDTERLAGQDRYGTAAEIAQELDPAGNKAVIATGENFPDALSVSAYASYNGMPILLTHKTYLPQATIDALSSLGITEALIVGGEGVVTQDVVNQLEGMGIKVTRAAGADRYETAVKIARSYFPSSASVFITTGVNFPDALCAGPVAARFLQSTLVLAKLDSAPPVLSGWLSERKFPQMYLVGGTGVLNDNLRRLLENI